MAKREREKVAEVLSVIEVGVSGGGAGPLACAVATSCSLALLPPNGKGKKELDDEHQCVQATEVKAGPCNSVNNPFPFASPPPAFAYRCLSGTVQQRNVPPRKKIFSRWRVSVQFDPIYQPWAATGFGYGSGRVVWLSL